MKDPRVFIIHGWEGSPEINWFPWLKHHLENGEAMARVFVPQMPNSFHPRMDEWLTEIRRQVGKPDENTFFVGHSLGVIAILRYLETMPPVAKIGGVVSVAGFAESLGEKELESFFQTPLDFKRVRGASKYFAVIDSDNDPYISLNSGDKLQKELDAKRSTMHGMGHFNGAAGCTSLPVALNALYDMMKINPVNPIH